MDYIENNHEAGERVKRIWDKYGNIISIVILLIVVAIVGRQYWHRHDAKIAGQASATYVGLLDAAATHKGPQVEALASDLMQNYSSSPYASMAAMIYAKQAVLDNNLPLAITQLTWAAGHAQDESFKSIAQLRLARVLIASKKPAQALTLLQTVQLPEMQAQAEATKGEAYLSLKQPVKAKQAYQAALTAAKKDSPLYAYIQMQLYSIKA
jgi:predicted negative regulator of RcsB-dependent stress response